MSLRPDYDPEQMHAASLQSLRDILSSLAEETKAKADLLTDIEGLDFHSIQTESGEEKTERAHGWRLPYLDQEMYLVPELDGIVAPLEDPEIGEFIPFETIPVTPEENDWLVLKKPPKYLLDFYSVEYACIALVLHMHAVMSGEPHALY